MILRSVPSPSSSPSLSRIHKQHILLPSYYYYHLTLLLLSSTLFSNTSNAFTIPTTFQLQRNTIIHPTRTFATKENEKFQLPEIQYDDDDQNEKSDIDINIDFHVSTYNDEDEYDDDYDDDENDDNIDNYVDEGQSYKLDYDDIIDVDHHQIEPSSSSYYDEYTRDEDDILTEREDRLYMDEKGQDKTLERCILVAVEDVAALRRDRLHNKLISEQRQLRPEEWEVYFTLEESMNEMRDLISTCGMLLVGEVTQRLNQVNPKTYIGTGKLKETMELLEGTDSCTVVFDAELSPGQQKSLENAFNKELMQNDFLGSEQLVSNFRYTSSFCCCC